MSNLSFSSASVNVIQHPECLLEPQVLRWNVWQIVNFFFYVSFLKPVLLLWLQRHRPMQAVEPLTQAWHLLHVQPLHYWLHADAFWLQSNHQNTWAKHEHTKKKTFQNRLAKWRDGLLSPKHRWFLWGWLLCLSPLSPILDQDRSPTSWYIVVLISLWDITSSTILSFCVSCPYCWVPQHMAPIFNQTTGLHVCVWGFDNENCGKSGELWWLICQKFIGQEFIGEIFFFCYSWYGRVAALWSWLRFHQICWRLGVSTQLGVWDGRWVWSSKQRSGKLTGGESRVDLVYSWARDESAFLLVILLY